MVKQYPSLQPFDLALAKCAHTSMHTKLAARIADHDRGTTSNDSKVKGRWSAGGFHMPGSNKK